ncbi:MAG: PAS domain-containing protein, partial [Chloroflexota bacterium]
MADDRLADAGLLRDALGAVRDSVVVLRAIRDDAGRLVDEEILYANQAWRRELGCLDAEPVGCRLTVAFPMLADRLTLHERVIESGVAYRAERPFNGGGRWFDVEYVPFGDGVIAVSRDATTAHTALDALAAREGEHAEAQRIAHVGSWTWEPAGDVVRWSDELFRIFGMEPRPEAPSFAEHSLLYTAETGAGLEAAVQRALEAGDPFEVPLEIVRRDGARRHVIGRGEVLRDGTGAIVGLRGTMADVTDLRAVELALREQETRYRAVEDSAVDAIVSVRDDGTIVAWNAAAERLFGYPGSEAIGQQITIVMGADAITIV